MYLYPTLFDLEFGIFLLNLLLFFKAESHYSLAGLELLLVLAFQELELRACANMGGPSILLYNFNSFI